MKWSIPSEQKLVSFLQKQLGAYSGKTLRRLLEANTCRINGKIERFGSKIVYPGDRVELASGWESALKPKSTLFETLYEDEALKIVNKPPGWVCDPKRTLETFGEGHHLVHRLDKETTGLLILAKGTRIRDRFRELFEERKIGKHYLALVDGILKEPEGERITSFIKKGSYEGQTVWGSGIGGAVAITRWKQIGIGTHCSLVLCSPITGRTHQIRVHLSEIGHPILIDRQYAKTFRCPFFAPRPFLHAYRLEFSFQGKEIKVTAPLFPDMRQMLEQVRISPPIEEL